MQTDNNKLMNIHSKVFLPLTLVFFNTVLNAAELVGIDVEQLKTMKQQQHPLVIDIRSTEEVVELGIIPGSKAIEFFDNEGNFDAKSWLAKLEQHKQTPEQAVVLVCLGGVRSKQVGEFMAEKLGLNDVYHLEGGLHSWKKQGNLTVKPE